MNNGIDRIYITQIIIKNAWLIIYCCIKYSGSGDAAIPKVRGTVIGS